MRFRKLRIAWSVLCGVVAVLLIAFWVRSYWWVDQAFVPVTSSTYLVLGSMPNAFAIGLTVKSPTGTGTMLNMPTVDWLAVGESSVTWSGARTFIINNEGFFLPYWFGVLLSATFAAAPWIRLPKRFSLRTLLIATTLIAVLLGLIVWLGG